MQVGILTGPFRNDPMDVVVSFAAEAGFDALEIDVRPGCKHLDVGFDDAAASDAVAQVRDGGLAIVMATHDLEQAERCDRIVELRDGMAVA